MVAARVEIIGLSGATDADSSAENPSPALGCRRGWIVEDEGRPTFAQRDGAMADIHDGPRTLSTPYTNGSTGLAFQKFTNTAS